MSRPRPNSTPTVYAMYRYGSTGERIMKIVRKSASDEVTLYIGGFERTLVGNIGGPPPTQYDELHLMDHGGRLACLLRSDPHPRDPFQDKQMRYQIADHLGSVVATLDDVGAALNTTTAGRDLIRLPGRGAGARGDNNEGR